MKTVQLVLKFGKEKPVQNFHPWIFSGAIDQIEEGYQAGDLVRVESSEGHFLGTGYINPKSQIAVRMLAFDDSAIDESFFDRRILAAIESRKPWMASDTNAYRIIHGENDGLPGLVADLYGDFLVIQIKTAGMERWREAVLQSLSKHLKVRGIFEKDDADWRRLEGLEAKHGTVMGEEPPAHIEIKENGVPLFVDVRGGQKTGFFLDQRDNRKLLGNFCQGKKVLNCFSYTGGFSVFAARAGALETISVDSSESALATAKLNFQANQMAEAQHRLLRTDVFQYLRQGQETFDVIVLDPPAFCQSKTQIDHASHAYKDINLFAMKRLNPGGILFSASCSSFISQDLFQKILFGAACDARRGLKILSKTSQPFDHPINIYFPEGEYLKGFFCQVA